MKKIVTLIIVALVAVTPLNVFAAKGDQGVDWAIYQANKAVLAMHMINSLLPRLVATMLAVFMNNTHINHK